MKRKISIILSAVMMLSVIFSMNVFAASYPKLSSSKYCEFTAAKKMTVYVDTNLKTPGTSNPYKKYSAYVSKNDVCYIYEITSKYVKVNYPTSSGRKTGFIKTSDLLGKNISPASSFKADKKVTTYKYKNGASTGYYESGDDVYKISGSNYNVMYTAKSGKRAYKLAYVNETSSSFDKVDSTSVKSDNNNYKVKLDKMINGSSYDGVFKVNTRYTGPRYNEQCKGFARTVHNKLFGYDIGSTNGNDYQINYSSSKTKVVGSVSSLSESSVKKLFSNARPGDFIQMKRRKSKKPHSAIVYEVSSTGVTFYDANTDGRNGIKKTTYTWAQLVSANTSMSVYTAKNY